LNGKLGFLTNPSVSTQLNQGHTLDLKQIKQIIDLMKRSELTEFAVEEEGFKLKIRRGLGELPVVSNTRQVAHTPVSVAEPVLVPANASAPATSAAAAETQKEEAGMGYIKSPMVGTFYRAPSPESKPFSDVGTKVVENTPVCIIEAMKIMNEIQAETKGTITEILVENGQPVEYGQRLFKVKLG
jgi:acetyl-CoA carboxylase biotin carboxyl carrier protein